MAAGPLVIPATPDTPPASIGNVFVEAKEATSFAWIPFGKTSLYSPTSPLSLAFVSSLTTKFGEPATFTSITSGYFSWRYCFCASIPPRPSRTTVSFVPTPLFTLILSGGTSNNSANCLRAFSGLNSTTSSSRSMSGIEPLV